MNNNSCDINGTAVHIFVLSTFEAIPTLYLRRLGIDLIKKTKFKTNHDDKCLFREYNTMFI